MPTVGILEVGLSGVLMGMQRRRAGIDDFTIEGLRTLRLPTVVTGLQEQGEHPDYEGLSFEDRLGLLIDKELTERQNRRLQRILKAATLRTPAVQCEDLTSD